MKDLAVYNAGVPGDTTLELLKRFNRDVAQYEPDLVLLLAGANDMFYPGHMLGIEACRRNMNALLDRVRNIGAESIIMTVPRFVESLMIENYPATLEHPLSICERLADLNELIKSLADERGIPLVDVFSLIDPVDDSAESLMLNPANSQRRDGMHFTAAGCSRVAHGVYEVIKREQPGARTIVCYGDSLTYGVYLKGKGSANIDAETYPGVLHKLLCK